MLKEPSKIILDSNLVYSLINKNLLFSIHYFKQFELCIIFKPYYSLIIIFWPIIQYSLKMMPLFTNQ